MNPILLSTVLLISFVYVSNCAPEDKQNQRNYYEYYAEAVDHYYREPRSPARAIAVLRKACRRVPDRQDVSCYNLGIILENEERPAEALEAYRRAWQLRRHPLYREAVQALAPEPGAYPTPYLRSFRRMVAACGNEDPKGALLELRRLIEDDRKATSAAKTPAAGQPGTPGAEGADGPAPAEEKLAPGGLHREIFAQPVFAECLAGDSEYADLLASLPERGGDVEAEAVHFRALNDPYHTLWDMELHLLRLTRSRDSDHPVTREWQGVMAARGSGGRAAGHLAAFLDELDRAVQAAGPGQREDLERRALAMKRAAAVLIDRDPFFGGIRGHGRVRALIAPYLRP